MLAVLFSACGGGSSNSADSTVRFGVFNWDGARLTTQILIEITERYPELGVEKTETKTLSTSVGWVGLAEGDIEVLPEVWFPNQKPLSQKYKQKTELVSVTYDHAAQGWFVPSYVVKQGGAAPRLKSVTQLDKYAQVFDSTLYDGPKGWVSTKWNTKRLKAYGLADEYKHVSAGESAYLAQLKEAYEDRAPMLFYLWRPHAIFAKYDLTQLEEPNPYQKGCFEKKSIGPCAMPESKVYVAVGQQFDKEAPKFHAFLGKFRIEIETMEKMLQKTVAQKQPISKVAKQWVDAHESKIRSWIPQS